MKIFRNKKYAVKLSKIIFFVFFFLSFILMVPGTNLNAEVIFHADFESDTPGNFPSISPDVGTIELVNPDTSGNEIIVQAPGYGGFSTNSLKILKGSSTPIFRGYPVTGAYNSGVFTIAWRSAAKQSNGDNGFAALAAPFGYSAFVVNYSSDGRILYQDGDHNQSTGPPNYVDTGVFYTVDVPQTFTAIVDLDNGIFDLFINGVQVATDAPIQSSSFTEVGFFTFQIGGTVTETYAIDDIKIETGAVIPDTDGDGMPDDWEKTYCLNPYDPNDAWGDLDGDGLSNVDEFHNGVDPQDPDTDGDKIGDGYEVGQGTYPDNPSSFPPLPLNWGSVMNVHQPDGSFATYLEVGIGNGFTGTLPDDITEITVSGPLTVPVYSGGGWIYYPQWRGFFVKVSGSPPTGTYAFTVNSGALTGTISDDQTGNTTIPVPNSPTFTQADGGTLSSKDPTFFWNDVSWFGGPTIYYRLEINEDAGGQPGNRVYDTGRVQNMLSFAVPNGVLNPGQKYWVRDRAVDNNNLVAVQNRAHSRWVPFTVERDPKRLSWFEVIVVQGNLYAEFDVLPGFTDKLLTAVLHFPNSLRSDHTYDLTNEKLVWDTECRYLDEWNQSFGSAVFPGDAGDYTLTLNFSDGAQEVYTHNLQEVIPALPVVSNINVAVYDDGNALVTWTPPAGNFNYQVRVRDAANKEYFRIRLPSGSTSAWLWAWDLRCLTKGQEYQWLVRVYDLNSNAMVTSKIPAYYSPAYIRHTESYGAYSWRSALALEFDTRPGSRDQIDSVTVTGPNSFSYTFDLDKLSSTTDWYSMSTETRLNMDGWWHEDIGWPITSGDYTFTADFDEDGNGTTDHTEALTRSLDVVPVYQVNVSNMLADIKPAGAIDFSWTLPVPSGQMYQVIIRDVGYTKEYYRSSDLYDISQVTASFWDLRGLEHGQTYQWFVRAFDPCTRRTMEQSDPKFFVYNPFDTDNNGIFDLYDDSGDNDGMPDSWELDNGLDPAIDDSDLDNDDDGLNNLAEYQLGTNPTNNDSDGDTYKDGEDAYPLDPSEWADFDGDGVGDNADNCVEDYNPGQENLDADGIGNVCDQDADGDTYISPYFPGGNDCDDLNPNVFPGDGISGCEAVSLKPKIPPVEEKPDSDIDGVDDTLDNCPSVANTGQSDTDGDGVGDVCDTCPSIDNPDQKVPVWYKDLDNDGYSNGKTLTHCDQPAGYKNSGVLTGMNDCDDSNNSIHPGVTEVLNNGVDDDCNPETLDIQPEYAIKINNITNNGQIVSYDEWLPVDGDTLVVGFKVVDVNGNEVQTPSFTFSLVQVTHHCGRYTNDSTENCQSPGPDFDYILNQNPVTLTSHDYGGSIIIHAQAEISVQGSPITIQKDFRFPRDPDGDGIAEAWESPYGDLDPTADPDGDGLTNLEEYRVVMWGQMDPPVGPNSTYQSPAYIPNNVVTPIRTNPTHRDLFVQFTGFDVTHPFAIGEAYHTREIDVHALDAAVVSAQNISDDFNIDVVTVTLADTTFGLETGHIIKRGVMDYTFATLGLSSYGSDTAYGANCTIYKTSIDYYFSDRPYKDYTTLGGDGNMRNQNNWGSPNNLLDAITAVEDKDDDGIKDGGEDKSGNGVLDGDYIVRAPAGSPDPWKFNQDLSPFNINNDSVPMVELPVADTNIEYTRAQVSKHVITHEIGHNVGVNIHTDDPLCVMYKYSTDWLRDNHFSDTAFQLIMIHNF